MKDQTLPVVITIPSMAEDAPGRFFIQDIFHAPWRPESFHVALPLTYESNLRDD
jgi:hypothetical protein